MRFATRQAFCRFVLKAELIWSQFLILRDIIYQLQIKRVQNHKFKTRKAQLIFKAIQVDKALIDLASSGKSYVRIEREILQIHLKNHDGHQKQS